jgi:hypothetical protein
MVLIGCTPKLKANNYLSMLTHTFDEDLSVDKLTNQVIVKLHLIFELQKSMLGFLMNKFKCSRVRLMHFERESKFFLVSMQSIVVGKITFCYIEGKGKCSQSHLCIKQGLINRPFFYVKCCRDRDTMKR